MPNDEHLKQIIIFLRSLHQWLTDDVHDHRIIDHALIRWFIDDVTKFVTINRSSHQCDESSMGKRQGRGGRRERRGGEEGVRE